MSETEQIGGECLCGAVRYRATGPWLRFVHCHCSRCRRATGTGHATNLFTAPENVEWISGKSDVVRYDLPGAQSFATCFCSSCGSPLPHLTRSGSAWVIPAGSLEREPSASPSARVFWSSRTEWSCGGDELSLFDGQIDE